MLARELAGGLNPTQAVQDIFRNQGITAIRHEQRCPAKPGGLYADTLVRSISADVHNEGAATHVAANGVEFALVIERETACKTWQPMRNQIVWLGDPRLRPKYHPRCEGGIALVIGKPENAIMSPDDPRIPQRTREAMLRKRGFVMTEEEKKEVALMIKKAVDAAIIQMRQEIVNAKKAMVDKIQEVENKAGFQ